MRWSAVVGVVLAVAAAGVLNAWGPDSTGAHALVLTEPSGVELYVRHWPAPPDAHEGWGGTRGVVVLVHGYTWHSAYFADVARSALNGAGFGAVAFDLAAHGLSGSLRGVRGLHSMQGWVDSVNLVAQHTRTQLGYKPGTPLFLLGESFGGALTLLAADKAANASAPPLAGLALLGAATGTPAALPPPVALAALAAVSRALPRLPAPSEVTREEAWIEAFGDREAGRRAWHGDPLVIKRAPIAVIPDLLPSFDAAAAAGSRFAAPLLVMHGSDDTRVPAAASVALHARAGHAPDKQLFVYPGARHQLFMDQAHITNLVIDDLLAWLAHHADKARGLL